MTFLHFNNNSDTPPPADSISKVTLFFGSFSTKISIDLFTQTRAITWRGNDKLARVTQIQDLQSWKTYKTQNFGLDD